MVCAAENNPQTIVLQNANNRLLLCMMAVVLLAGMMASWIQTSGGRVRVHDIKIPTQNGQWVVGDVCRP